MSSETTPSSPPNDNSTTISDSTLALPPSFELETKFTSLQLRQMLQERNKQQQIWESEIAGATVTLQTQKNVGMHQSLVDPEGFPRDDIDVWAVRQARHAIATRQNDLKLLGDELKTLLEAIFAVLAREGSAQAVTEDGGAETGAESIEERNTRRFEQRRRERDEKLKQKLWQEFNDQGGNSSNNGSKQKADEESKQQKLNKLWEEAGVVPVATVREVLPHSPSFLAGLIDGDVVVAVGLDVGTEHLQPEDSIQPLLSLGDFAAAVKKSEGKTLRVIVQRSVSNNKNGNNNNNNNKKNIVDCVLVPKQWSGNGILGCGLDPIRN